jgi:hypothetical protein
MDNKINFVIVKSLYGLKETHKQWHVKFEKVMLSNEFKINKVDRYVYMKKINIGYIIIYFYVDDMLILINNDHMIKLRKY